MNNTNINDLTNLIIEKEKTYSFRKLEKKDAQEITLLMTNSFLHDNPAFQILKVQEEDIKTCFTAGLFEKMINENLSFGAFYENKLVSACLTYDLWSNNEMVADGEQPTQVILEILGMVESLLGKYGDPQIYKQKEIAYLSHLATHTDYVKQNLALSCAYLSVQECRKLGFQQMITEAAHLGTYKSFSKIFKNFEVIKEINELKGQPAQIISLIGSLTPQ